MLLLSLGLSVHRERDRSSAIMLDDSKCTPARIFGLGDIGDLCD